MRSGLPSSIPMLVAALTAVVVTPAVGRQRAAGEDLMQVVTPITRSVAVAHPHVNVVVSFGAAKDGTPADPSTFRAKLNGRDVTGDFHATSAAGVQTGVRAALAPRLLRFARSPRNRLRLSIRGAGGKRTRDVDRLRFGAADGPNQLPVVVLAAGNETATLGRAVDFDASGSHDPDNDELTFAWTFSDAGTDNGPTVSHAFTTATDAAMVSATVAVSDGVSSVPQTVDLPVALEVDPNRTPGVLRIEAAGALEFSAVAVGSSATRSLTVRNVDTAATSQVKVHALVNDPAFTVEPPTMDLGPDASATLVVTFAPSATGHASARLMLLASASNRGAVGMLAHGFGGSAPDDGPTQAAVPIYAIFGSDVVRIAPDGARLAIDDRVGACVVTPSTGSGDACAVNGDCATSGEVCTAPSTPLDVTELCSDADGLFVLSENTFTDLRDDPDTELSGTLVRFDLDAAGTVTGREVLYRTTEDTVHLACDGFGGSAGGLAYLSEVRTVADTATCERDDREALVSVNKATGNARTVSGLARIDQAAGVGDCDFRDGVSQLEVAVDGVKKYAGFDLHGLWRIAPTPLPFTPDVRDGFQVHPDGSIVFAIAHDRGTTGTIDLYRLTEAQVEHGALPVSALAPCASLSVPNDTTAAAPATTVVTSIVIGASALVSGDATALVTFRARALSPAVDVLPPFGDVRGTAAFSLPAGTSACSAAGLVSLRAEELSR